MRIRALARTGRRARRGRDRFARQGRERAAEPWRRRYRFARHGRDGTPRAGPRCSGAFGARGRALACRSPGGARGRANGSGGRRGRPRRRGTCSSLDGSSTGTRSGFGRGCRRCRLARLGMAAVTRAADRCSWLGGRGRGHPRRSRGCRRHRRRGTGTVWPETRGRWYRASVGAGNHRSGGRSRRNRAGCGRDGWQSRRHGSAGDARRRLGRPSGAMASVDRGAPGRARSPRAAVTGHNSAGRRGCNGRAGTASRLRRRGLVRGCHQACGRPQRRARTGAGAADRRVRTRRGGSVKAIAFAARVSGSTEHAGRCCR
jgi:hypothetical protein